MDRVLTFAEGTPNEHEAVFATRALQDGSGALEVAQTDSQILHIGSSCVENAARGGACFSAIAFL